MAPDPRLLEYDRAAPSLRAHGEHLREQLATLLASDAALKLHSIEARMKTRESLANKLARPDRTYGSLWDVTDVVGLRVITYFEDGVDRVGRVVEQRLPVDLARSVDKRREIDARRFGYRSLHYVCRAEHGEWPAARYEIQVRSMLEHAWAEIEHDLGYKSRDAVPADVRRRLSRLAGMLELADQEFVAIRKELHAYAADLPARIAEHADDVPLDPLSIRALLDGADVRALDEAIARAANTALGGEPFFPEYLAKLLAAAEIRTVADARAGFARHGAAIVAMVAPYFAFAARRGWSLRLDALLRGYSLFFLAHAAVLDAHRLDVHRTGALARVYRELDHPDDPAAAQEIAHALVAALREANVLT